MNIITFAGICLICYLLVVLIEREILKFVMNRKERGLFIALDALGKIPNGPIELFFHICRYA